MVSTVICCIEYFISQSSSYATIWNARLSALKKISLKGKERTILLYRQSSTALTLS